MNYVWRATSLRNYNAGVIRSRAAYRDDPFALTRALNDNNAAVLRMRALREKEKEA